MFILKLWYKIHNASYKARCFFPFLFIAQASVSISGTGLHRGFVMKYRLAMEKQLFTSRLSDNSCPISRDPPSSSAASRPAVLLHFLPDAVSHQKN